MAASHVASNQLVTTPWPLYHLDGLAVCKATIALWACIRRRNECLVGLAIRAIQEVGEEAAGL